MNRVFKVFVLLMLGILTITACRTEPKEEKVDYKRTDNTVVIRLRAEPDRLNPILTTNNYATQINSQLFMYLTTINPKTYEFEPFLAKSLPVVEEITEGPLKGGVAYTFEILDEAVWDNGSPVTANDYIFTIKTVLNPLVQAQRIRPYLAFIKDIQVDPNNPKKFTVYTNEKYILGEEAVANTVPVIPEYVYDPEGLMRNFSIADLSDATKSEKLAKSDARLNQFAEAFNSPKFSREKGFISGCGAYQFDEWRTGQKIIISRKTNWWGDKLADKYPALAAYPDKMEFVPVGDNATALAALKAEEMDVISELDAKDFVEVRDAQLTKERYNFFTPPQLAYSTLYLNNENPKLADKRVRRALAHAINVDEIIQTVYNGFGERVAVPVNPGAPYVNGNLQPIPYRIENAKALLKEAGWEDTNGNGIVDKKINGQLVELNLSCYVSSASETGRNTLLLAQGTLKQAGVNLEIVPQEFTVYMDKVRKNDFEMASGGRTISPTLWEPSQDWYSEGAAGGDNHNNFKNAEADRLIDQIRVTLDEKKRNELYERLQQIIYEEQPGIFLFYPTGRIAVHKRFTADAYTIFPGFLPNEFKLNLQ